MLIRHAVDELGLREIADCVHDCQMDQGQMVHEAASGTITVPVFCEDRSWLLVIRGVREWGFADRARIVIYHIRDLSCAVVENGLLLSLLTGEESVLTVLVDQLDIDLAAEPGSPHPNPQVGFRFY